MYLNKAIINTTAAANGGSGFANYLYWSSTESDFNDAWEQYFDYGSQSNDFKFGTNYVRAVRAF